MSNNKMSVEWLAEEYAKYIERPWIYVKNGGKQSIIEQAKKIQEEQMIDFANWCRIHDSYHKNEVWMIGQLYTKYLKEKYGSND